MKMTGLLSRHASGLVVILLSLSWFMLLPDNHVQVVAFSTTAWTNSGGTRKRNAFTNLQNQPPMLQRHNSHVLQAASSSSSPTPNSFDELQDDYDVIVVGSGLGGLSCAAMLAHYGSKVLVLESHYAPGGAAHGYSLKTNGGTFHFDTGPSFFSGLNPDLPSKASNPMRTILDAIDEQVECIPYTSFGLKFPEGDLIHTSNFGGHHSANHNHRDQTSVLEQVAGPQAVQEWQQLMAALKPLEKAVDAMPTAALRGDISALVTVLPFLPNFATLNPLDNLKLTKPFSSLLQDVNIQTPFLQNWLDLLCFCLSGLPSNGTITAEMSLMMGEFYDPNAVMDCPKGGAKALVDALVRGIQKKGGQVVCQAHVDEILLSSDGKPRATGVRLKKKNRIVKAKQAVVSNLSIWNLLQTGILDTSALPDSYVTKGNDTPVGKSFMHLHLGFRATRQELEALQAHYMYIDDWDRGVTAPDNAVLISIPSVHDDSLAPSGHAVLHAYTPATEDYGPWANLKRNSPEYQTFKEERSQYLWKVVEKIIPDIRDRITVQQVGTPLTHERFLRRHQGSYGPAIVAPDSFPFPKTPIPGLLVCGDSCFPGIGVPAVAGSGLLAAHSVSLDSIPQQQQLLQDLKAIMK